MWEKDEKREEDGVVIENAEELEQLEYSGDSGIPVFQQIRLTKKDFSVFELHRKYKTGKLILDVDFQRGNVWKPKQKCELIESILMGLPLPIFYLKQEDNATYIVVDGKQRLSALFQFLDNGFALKNLRILPFLNGVRYQDLTGKLGIYQSQLEDYQVYSHVILPPTPDKILFDIFDRVNRGGTQLNKQEIRNALYHGNGLKMIRRVTESEAFRAATRIDCAKDSRMRGSYLLTRFLAFYLLMNGIVSDTEKKREYSGDVDELIVNALKYLNRSPKDILEKYERMLEEELEAAHMIFGDGAFRKELKTWNPINMNIFETTMYALTLIRDPEKYKKRIYSGIEEIINSAEFLVYIGDGRDSAGKVSGRFSMMRKLAEEINDDR